MGASSFSDCKAAGEDGVNHLPSYNAEVKERVELHINPICDFMAGYRVKFDFTLSVDI
jgi:hypothetical protein